MINSLSMRSSQTRYVLEVLLLPRPFKTVEDLQSATRVTQYESTTAFGTFQKGDTLSHGMSNSYLGIIQHVHHRVGLEDGSEVVQRTLIYGYVANGR
jgi:CII-binding regulator of phage lambda lysogenization HflD